MIEISLPRIFSKFLSAKFDNSVPLKFIEPSEKVFFKLKRFKIDKAVIDFPLPDSPTIPSVSFLFRSKETLDRILLAPIFNDKFWIDKIFLFIIKLFNGFYHFQ